MKGIVTYGYPWNPKPRFVQSKLRKLPDIQDGGSMDPPRSGWEVPYENRGVVTQVRYGLEVGVTKYGLIAGFKLGLVMLEN